MAGSHVGWRSYQMHFMKRIESKNDIQSIKKTEVRVMGGYTSVVDCPTVHLPFSARGVFFQLLFIGNVIQRHCNPPNRFNPSAAMSSKFGWPEMSKRCLARQLDNDTQWSNGPNKQRSGGNFMNDDTWKTFQIRFSRHVKECVTKTGWHWMWMSLKETTSWETLISIQCKSFLYKYFKIAFNGK